MSYSISFKNSEGEDGPFSLCSIGAWTAFLGYVQQLPDKFVSLKALVETGHAPNTELLSEELIDAATDHAPKDAVVGKMLAALSDVTGTGAPDESASIED
jgi:hypothetical protein